MPMPKYAINWVDWANGADLQQKAKEKLAMAQGINPFEYPGDMLPRSLDMELRQRARNREEYEALRRRYIDQRMHESMTVAYDPGRDAIVRVSAEGVAKVAQPKLKQSAMNVKLLLTLGA